MKCKLCKKGKGEVPIVENDKEIWICEKCDEEMYSREFLEKKLLREIGIQIRFHKLENDIPAINSLEHIKNIINSRFKMENAEILFLLLTIWIFTFINIITKGNIILLALGYSIGFVMGELICRKW